MPHLHPNEHKWVFDVPLPASSSSLCNASSFDSRQRLPLRGTARRQREGLPPARASASASPRRKKNENEPKKIFDFDLTKIKESERQQKERSSNNWGLCFAITDDEKGGERTSPLEYVMQRILCCREDTTIRTTNSLLLPSRPGNESFHDHSTLQWGNHRHAHAQGGLILGPQREKGPYDSPSDGSFNTALTISDDSSLGGDNDEQQEEKHVRQENHRRRRGF